VTFYFFKNYFFAFTTVTTEHIQRLSSMDALGGSQAQDIQNNRMKDKSDKAIYTTTLERQ